MYGKSTNKYIKEEVDYLKEELKHIKLSSITLDNSLVADLIEAFEKSIIDLRETVESNKPPLLEKIYGELYGNRGAYPVKAIVEIPPDPYLSRVVTFEKNTKFSVKEIFFSFLEEVTIWPVTILSTTFIESYNFNDMEKSLNTNSSHLLKIVIGPLNLPLRTMKMSSLRFFVEGSNSESFITALFMNNNVFNIFYRDSQVRNESNKAQNCTIEYEIPHISTDINMLKDFGNLQQMYHFFTIKNFNLAYIFENLVLYIPINFYRNIMNIQLKLFNFIAINLFDTISHPLTIDFQQTEQQIVASAYNNTLKIYKIKKIALLQTKESLENWHSYNLQGKTYVSFFQCNNALALNGQRVYGEMQVYNGDGANTVKPDDRISIINYNNFQAFINYVDNYMDNIMDSNTLQTYLNTDFKLLLNDKEEFQKHINNIIKLVMPNYDLLINNITLIKTVETTRWINIPLPIPTKIINLTFNTNRDEIWLFLNVLWAFINELSFANEKIILTTLWKGKEYVIR